MGVDEWLLSHTSNTEAISALSLSLSHLEVFYEFVAAESHEEPPMHPEDVVRHDRHDALALQDVQVPYPQGQAERDLKTDRTTKVKVTQLLQYTVLSNMTKQLTSLKSL